MPEVLLAGVLLARTLASDGAPEPQNEPAEPEATTETVALTEPAPGIWDDLARCESTSRWNLNSGRYTGGLQFDAPTWRRYGGLEFAPAAYLATRAQQILIAERTLAVQGWSAWPVCSRVIGMRR